MKNNLLKYLLLLNGVLSILAACPSYPTIPTTFIPKTNPLVLTSASEGMITLNPSLTKLSITMTATLDEECSNGYWELFTLTVHPSGQYEYTIAEFFIDCNSFDLWGGGNWISQKKLVSKIFTGSSRTVNIYVTIDLESGAAFAEANSADAWNKESFRTAGGGLHNFDETTKLYLCSYINTAESALACTVSRLQLVSMYDSVLPNHLGDFTPVTQAFYPLSNGELSSLIKSADSAYFGDKASSPTAGSSPSWDSSKSFVQIKSETQFLTLPVPSVAENSIIPPTITFAFWVRITSIPQESAILFSLILEDETTAFSIVVSKDSLEISGINMKDYLKITLDTWQLISCSLYVIPVSGGNMPVTLSVGDSQTPAMNMNLGGLKPTKLQIGDSEYSFIGDISSARILSSGAGYLTDSDACAPNNAIQINSGPYAISCAEGSSFNPYDNKCYSSCPLDPVTPFTDAPFTLCLSEEAEEPEEPENPEEPEEPEEPETPEEPEEPSTSITVEESGGLSGGQIAGIAVGSVAGVAALGAIGYFGKLTFAKAAAKKAAAKAYQIQMSSPTTETIPNTTTNMVAP